MQQDVTFSLRDICLVLQHETVNKTANQFKRFCYHVPIFSDNKTNSTIQNELFTLAGFKT